MSVYSIAVDLGGTNLRIAAISEEGKLLEKVTTGTEVQKGRDFVIREMTDAIQSLNAKHRAQGELAGIGIGVPGFIDIDTGIIARSPNLPGWENFPVREQIERNLNTKVFLENDANVAAMGEKWLGAGRNTPDMAMYTLGTGVGGGIILNGQIWHGMNGMANELGHFNVEPDGHPCGCGSRGCLEQYASATAIVRMAHEAIDSGDAPDLDELAHGNVEFTSRNIYQLAIQKHPSAGRIYQRVGRALGIAIGSMVNALNLPMYVIGGGASSAWDAYAPSMFEELKFRSFIYKVTAPDVVKPGQKHTVVTIALMGSDAGLYGAAWLPILGRQAQSSATRGTAAQTSHP
jgi:glucokinase